MEWIPIAAWALAAVIMVVVLGYCAYEIMWKARRLQRDVTALQGLAGQLTELQGGIAAAQERLAATRLR